MLLNEWVDDSVHIVSERNIRVSRAVFLKIYEPLIFVRFCKSSFDKLVHPLKVELYIIVIPSRQTFVSDGQIENRLVELVLHATALGRLTVVNAEQPEKL